MGRLASQTSNSQSHFQRLLSINSNPLATREYTSICDNLDLDLTDVSHSPPATPQCGNSLQCTGALLNDNDSLVSRCVDSPEVHNKHEDYLHQAEDQQREKNLKKLCKNLRKMSANDPDNAILKFQLRQLSMNETMSSDSGSLSRASSKESL